MQCVDSSDSGLAIATTSARDLTEGGIGLEPFGSKHFDRHWHFRTDLADEVLAGRDPGGERGSLNRVFPQYVNQPEYWGLKVRLIGVFWRYVREDMLHYASAHDVDENGKHVCVVSPCGFRHIPHISYVDAQAPQRPKRCNANMHLVVDRYIKPWTEGRGVGISLLFNSAYLAALTDMRDPANLCKAEVFISHWWGEKFEEFVRTLETFLHSETSVWVCSFAIYQHGDITASLENVEKCPFARAILAIPKVLCVLDRTAGALQRCWVVLEAQLACQWDKPYLMSTHDCRDADLWREVASKVSQLDMRQCKASCPKDRLAILQYAQNHGGVERLNNTVRDVAKKAAQNAEIFALCQAGELSRLPPYNELVHWRSLKGGTLLHVAAKFATAATVVELMHRTHGVLLNATDTHMRTPLSAAAAHSNLANVVTLVRLNAALEIENVVDGTALHQACFGGHTVVAEVLVDAHANIEAQTRLHGLNGFTPLLISAFEGHAGLIQMLARHNADFEAENDSGMPAISIAAKCGHSNVIAALIGLKGYVDLGKTEDCGRTPLLHAVRHGHFGVTALLLGACAKMEACSDRWGCVWDCLKHFEEREPSRAEMLRDLLLTNVAHHRSEEDRSWTSLTRRLHRVSSKFENFGGCLNGLRHLPECSNGKAVT